MRQAEAVVVVEQAIQAHNRATNAHSELIFFLIEGLVMPQTFIPGRWVPGKMVDGEYRKGYWREGQFVGDPRLIVDYEPEKMALLVMNGNMEIGTLSMYRTACEHSARHQNGLDETRRRRYHNVVTALELLAKQEAMNRRT